MKTRFPALLLALLLLLGACAAPAPGEAAPASPSTGAEEEREPLSASAPETPPQLIAHAGGAVYGFRLSNSLEALENAYAQGHRFIELDFERSADGEPVLIHDWESMAARMLGSEGCRTRADFLSAAAFAGLTLLDLDGLLDWLGRHSDCSIVTDVKCQDNPGFLRELRERAGELADRFIPQIYAYEDYEAVAELGYGRIILTLYRLPLDLEALGDFARENRPWGITVAQSRLSRELLAAVEEASPDTAVFSHTVNDYYLFETWQPLGLTGIYTDYFVPDHWPAGDPVS